MPGDMGLSTWEWAHNAANVTKSAYAVANGNFVKAVRQLDVITHPPLTPPNKTRHAARVRLLSTAGWPGGYRNGFPSGPATLQCDVT